MFDYTPLYDRLAASPAHSWLDTLSQQVEAALQPQRHGHLGRWREAIAQLPCARPSEIDLLDAVRIGVAEDMDAPTQQQLVTALKQLHPWRKGPFHLFGIHIDAEWRSDWKWHRLKPYIQPLTGRTVLDVGCGNGYYALRMLGAGAKVVIGLDPSLLFAMQYAAICHYLPEPNAYVLPLGIEQLAPNLHAFDTAFSMGVLYHRRSPLEHLATLRDALRPGGELALETLVLDSHEDKVLVPEQRYARMRNVWAIPSHRRLVTWLSDCGFEQVRIADVTPTTTQEQRQTEWMTFHSLENFLNPNDASQTIEGYPAPVRAIAIGQAPSRSHRI
ncbi:tRNA 5-methoxyuridine(34)/uridine 5-oxyacetic acid(34) synthase CmoB [Synechococcus sp. PCC 7336]|uniref:tRNA 5-methoxyuridine(34)/uridine 5-oxyacetic acid(34) synthase CmoB n=1 Tax=Synechococcus sp. PCC 7336 TaxID=195250 RepID=UPI0003463C6F|nr:tRNA 5-methoxyuridine(34)/uridine 5-oxyacetic acid(34) synthase CmoB [Synechococcus sp. PCC 7336]